MKFITAMPTFNFHIALTITWLAVQPTTVYFTHTARLSVSLQPRMLTGERLQMISRHSFPMHSLTNKSIISEILR